MPNAASRDVAIEHAAKLFQRQGYAATGVAQIIEVSGTPKGSFYFNFPGGKEEVAAEALALSGGRLGAAIEQLAQYADGPEPFIDTLVDLLAAGLGASDFTMGCPIATVVLEMAADSARLQQAALLQFERWQVALGRGLSASAASDRPSEAAIDDESSRAAGTEALMLIEGALLMSKVARSIEPMEHLRRGLRRLI